MQVFKKFECPICYAKYDEKESAEKCCPAEVNIKWGCGVCKTMYTTKERALKCCPGQAEDGNEKPSD